MTFSSRRHDVKEAYRRRRSHAHVPHTLHTCFVYVTHFTHATSVSMCMCVCCVFVLCMCVCVFTHVHLRVFHGDGFLRRAADVRSLIECIVSFGTASSSSSSHMRTHEKPARPFDPHAHARRWLRVHRIARSDPRSTRVVFFLLGPVTKCPIGMFTVGTRTHSSRTFQGDSDSSRMVSVRRWPKRKSRASVNRCQTNK